MSARLDIDSLNTLKAIAERGGVTRAADYLALSQSAVSHKIKRLEQSIDCKLLQRKAGKPQLTDAGERLLEYARRILELHDEALACLGNKFLEGQLHIGTTEDITSSSLAKILARFTRIYPSVSVSAHVDQSLVLEKKLHSGEVDLAVMQLFTNKTQQGDLVYHRDSLVWVCALDYQIDYQKPLPFIAFDKDCFYRQWAYEKSKNSKLRVKTILQCPSINGVCNAVEAGLGVALISQHNMRTGMRPLMNDLPTPPEVAYLVRSRSNRKSKVEQALINEIVREVRVRH